MDLIYDDIELHIDVPVTQVNNQDKDVIVDSDSIVTVLPDQGYTGLSSVEITPVLQSKIGSVTANGQYVYQPNLGFCGMDSCIVDVNVRPPLQDKVVDVTSNVAVDVVPDNGYYGLHSVSVVPVVQNKFHSFTQNGVFNVMVSDGYVGIKTIKCNVDVRTFETINSVYFTSIPNFLQDPHGDTKILRSFDVSSNFEVINSMVDVSNGSGMRLFCNTNVLGGIRPSYTGVFICFNLDKGSNPSYPDTITVSMKNVTGSKNIFMSPNSLGVWFGGNYDENSLEFNGNLLIGDYVTASRSKCFTRIAMGGYDPVLGESVTSFGAYLQYLKYFNLNALRLTYNRVTNSNYYSF